MQSKQIILLFLVILLKYSQSADCSERFDSKMKSHCENLYINSTHSCSYSNGICSFKYKTCSYYKGGDESICESIKPSSNYQKCKIKNSKCTEVYKECDEYDPNGSLSCTSLYGGSSLKHCVLQNQNCKAHYEKCEYFTTGVDKAKCEANIPSTDYHKCIWDSANNLCKEVPKDCKDYSSTYFYSCNSLTPSSTDKICVSAENSNYCEEIYKTCDLYNTKETSKTKAGCEKTKIYSDTGNFDETKICEFIGTTCSARDKVCEDMIDSYDCRNFSPKDSNKICVYRGNQCITQYKTCDLYNSKVAEVDKKKEDCEAIQVYSESTNSFDNHYYCSYSGTTCSQEERKCEDFTEESECENFSPSDKTICVFNQNACKEQYKTCEIYNSEVTDKNKEDCEAIKIYDYGFDTSSKCVFNEGACSKTKKDCSEFTDSNSCNYHEPNDENKKCRFIQDKCEEQYKTCELYNDKESQKTKEECEKIIPYKNGYSSVDEDSKCVFDTDSNCVRKTKECSEMGNNYNCYGHKIDNEHVCTLDNNECKQVYTSCSGYNKETDKTAEGCKALKIYNSNGYIDYSKKCIFEDNTCKDKTLEKCEDYETGKNENYCTHISNSYSNCIFKNNQCVKEYYDCPEDYEEVTEEVCKSITPWTEYYKCSYDEKTKKCTRQNKECSEFKNSDYYYYCDIHGVPSEDKENKKCFFENSKCIEKYIHCSAYTGNNKTECESIIPYDEYKNSLRYTNKCVFGNDKKCKMELKVCEDAKTKNECNSITPTNNKKRCVYENEECKEQYKDCDSYNNNGEETVTKSVCESIILSSDSYKCVFKEGNTCEEEKKDCSDITKDKYEQECSEISASSSEKKCSFSNSVCSEVSKSCLELSLLYSATNDICSSAPTSNPSNKVCVKKEEGIGCEEKDKSSDSSNQSGSSSNPSSSSGTGQNNNQNNQNNQNNKGTFVLEFKFSLLFIIFGLFL